MYRIFNSHGPLLIPLFTIWVIAGSYYCSCVRSVCEAARAPIREISSRWTHEVKYLLMRAVLATAVFALAPAVAACGASQGTVAGDDATPTDALEQQPSPSRTPAAPKAVSENGAEETPAAPSSPRSSPVAQGDTATPAPTESAASPIRPAAMPNQTPQTTAAADETPTPAIEPRKEPAPEPTKEPSAGKPTTSSAAGRARAPGSEDSRAPEATPGQDSRLWRRWSETPSPIWAPSTRGRTASTPAGHGLYRRSPFRAARALSHPMWCSPTTACGASSSGRHDTGALPGRSFSPSPEEG